MRFCEHNKIHRWVVCSLVISHAVGSDDVLCGQELLDAYLIDFNSLSSKINYLRSQIQSAEESVRWDVCVCLCMCVCVFVQHTLH